MNEVITDVENNKFSDFSAKVKKSLEDKLANNPKVQSAADKINKLDNINKLFKQIQGDDKPVTPDNGDTVEPQDHSEPQAPAQAEN